MTYHVPDDVDSADRPALEVSESEITIRPDALRRVLIEGEESGTAIILGRVAATLDDARFGYDDGADGETTFYAVMRAIVGAIRDVLAERKF